MRRASPSGSADSIDFHRYVREQLASLATPREPEILEELAQHLEDLYREARSAGFGHEEALALDPRPDGVGAGRHPVLEPGTSGPAARPSSAALSEPSPAPRHLHCFSAFLDDVRFAIRSLLRASGFSVVTVVTLALGIGATAVMFSAIDAVLLRDAPVARPDRVVSVYTRYPARATVNPRGGDQFGVSSYPDYLDLRASGVLAHLAAFEDVLLRLDADAGVEPLEGRVVSGNYFEVLGVQPILGRALQPGDDVRASPVRVVVLSHRLWRQRFGADEGIVGRRITLNGNATEVVGVAPPGFNGPIVGDAADAWVPMALQEEVRPPSAGPLRQRLGGRGLLAFRDVRWLDMVGRLRDGQSIAEASARLEVVGQRLAAAYPDSNRDLGAGAVALGSGPGLQERTRPVLLLLATAVTLVLLIACANVAGLMLTRAAARQREVAIRAALGAGRWPIVRQWVVEAVMLGVLGATAGLLLVFWAEPLLRGLGIPDTVEMRVNLRVLAFTLAAGVSSGLLFGLAPVLHLVRRDALAGLREEGSAVAAGPRTARLRGAFVVAQVATSLVLLVGAGLFARTLQQAYAVDLGYDIDRMLVVDLTPGEDYSPESGLALYEALLDRVNALPGVLSAGAARVTVLSGGSRMVGVSVDGQPVRDDRSNAIPVRVNVVSPGYLNTMGIAVAPGRPFDATDVASSPRVAIISRSLAERLWPGSDPIGRVLVGELIGQDASMQVIGVVPDTVYLRSTERDPRPFFYLPLPQNYENGVSLHIRTVGDPMALLAAVRQITRSLDSRLALARPRRLIDEFDRSIETERVLARLTGILSGIALALAAVGLYGVMAHNVKQRMREVGLRLAIGATPASIVQLVVGRGARLVAIGLALGLAGAFGSVRFVRNQLFGIEPTDPLTWLGVSVLLLVVGLIACGIPACRAAKVAPATVLRCL